MSIFWGMWELHQILEWPWTMGTSVPTHTGDPLGASLFDSWPGLLLPCELLPRGILPENGTPWTKAPQKKSGNMKNHQYSDDFRLIIHRVSWNNHSEWSIIKNNQRESTMITNDPPCLVEGLWFYCAKDTTKAPGRLLEAPSQWHRALIWLCGDSKSDSSYCFLSFSYWFGTAKLHMTTFCWPLFWHQNLFMVVSQLCSSVFHSNPWRIVIGGQRPEPHCDAFGGFALGFHQRRRALTHLR